MSIQRGKKLNSLQLLLPEGLSVDAAWLEGRGYSSALRRKYVKNGWLRQPTRGTYTQPGTVSKWQHHVVSMQSLLRIPVAVGGLTALELQGYGHYVRVGADAIVYLYTERALPRWVAKLEPSLRIEERKTERLFKGHEVAAAVATLPEPNVLDGFEIDQKAVAGLKTIPWGDRPWQLIVSRPERAILEFLNELPDRQSFDHAEDLFSGLVNLSPRVLQRQLVACKNVKVTRLFLFFAERFQHPWLRHLDQDAIDVGSGKRVIAKSGRLDKKYQITVPETFDGG